MWFTVIFFAFLAILAVGAFAQSRKRRAINRRWRAGLSADPGHAGYHSGSFYGHGSWHGGVGDAGSGSFGDCGGGGGGGGGDGGGGGGC
jgi:hypothetical protein